MLVNVSNRPASIDWIVLLLMNTLVTEAVNDDVRLNIERVSAPVRPLLLTSLSSASCQSVECVTTTRRTYTCPGRQVVFHAMYRSQMHLPGTTQRPDVAGQVRVPAGVR